MWPYHTLRFYGLHVFFKTIIFCKRVIFKFTTTQRKNCTDFHLQKLYNEEIRELGFTLSQSKPLHLNQWTDCSIQIIILLSCPQPPTYSMRKIGQNLVPGKEEKSGLGPRLNSSTLKTVNQVQCRFLEDKNLPNADSGLRPVRSTMTGRRVQQQL